MVAVMLQKQINMNIYKLNLYSSQKTNTKSGKNTTPNYSITVTVSDSGSIEVKQ